MDPSSPHSLSEVLSGALFAVLVSSVESALDAPPRVHADPFRSAVLFAINRLGSLVFRGLDWLPPGEVTLADAIRAMLAADGINHADRPDERQWLAEECVRRRIIDRRELDVDEASGVGVGRTFDGMRAAAGPALHDAVIERVRPLAPPASVFDVTSRRVARASAILVERRHAAESVQLDREYPEDPAAPAITLVKVAWWETRDIDLGTDRRETLAVRTGLTIVFDDRGQPVSVLRSAGSRASDERRRAFRIRLAKQAAAVAHTPAHDPAGAAAGPRAADGAPAVRHATGSFALLHVAGLEDLQALPAIPAPRVPRRRRSAGG